MSPTLAQADKADGEPWCLSYNTCLVGSGGTRGQFDTRLMTRDGEIDLDCGDWFAVLSVLLEFYSRWFGACKVLSTTECWSQGRAKLRVFPRHYEQTWSYSISPLWGALLRSQRAVECRQLAGYCACRVQKADISQIIEPLTLMDPLSDKKMMIGGPPP